MRSIEKRARTFAVVALLALVAAVGGCSEQGPAVGKEATNAKQAEAGSGKKAHAEGKDAKEEAKDGHGAAEKKEEGIELSPERQRAQGVVTSALERKPVSETLRAAAEIGFNERSRVVISARAGGRAEKVSVFANQRVRADELLAEIYSPEFLSVQQEYLLIRDRAKRGGAPSPETPSLLTAAEQRLRLFGVTENEIEELARTGKAYPFLHVHSPINGTVIEHKLSAGDTVESGKALYVIADLNSVWADIALTETQLSRVKPGQPVTVTTKTYPDRRFTGELLSLGAHMDEATRTVKARALIRNPGERLKPGMFAEAEIAIGGGEPTLALPEEAVLRNPDGDWVVFIEEEPGRFKPKEVKVLRGVGNLLVIEGVKAGARVVTKGAFFVQSEIAKGGFDTHGH